MGRLQPAQQTSIKTPGSYYRNKNCKNYNRRNAELPSDSPLATSLKAPRAPSGEGNRAQEWHSNSLLARTLRAGNARQQELTHNYTTLPIKHSSPSRNSPWQPNTLHQPEGTNHTTSALYIVQNCPLINEVIIRQDTCLKPFRHHCHRQNLFHCTEALLVYSFQQTPAI